MSHQCPECGQVCFCRSPDIDSEGYFTCYCPCQGNDISDQFDDEDDLGPLGDNETRKDIEDSQTGDVDRILNQELND